MGVLVTMVVVIAPYIAVSIWAVVVILGSLFTSASLLLFALCTQRESPSEKAPQSPSKSQQDEEEEVLEPLLPAEQCTSAEDECQEIEQAEEVEQVSQAVEPESSPLMVFHEPHKSLSDPMEEPVLAVGPTEEALELIDVDQFGDYFPNFLLPPRMDLNDQRLTIVLDLDETLVRSCEEEDVPLHMEFAASVGLLDRIEVVCVDPQTGAQEKIVSFLRPGIHQFLECVSSFAEVVLFTAGDPEYAAPLVAQLDPEGKYFSYCLFREATVATPQHMHVKDLLRLGRDMARIVLVDNNPCSFLFQPENGILCEGFYGDPSDRHLLEATLPLLKLLAFVQDVRPVLTSRCVMY